MESEALLPRSEVRQQPQAENAGPQLVQQVWGGGEIWAMEHIIAYALLLGSGPHPAHFREVCTGEHFSVDCGFMFFHQLGSRIPSEFSSSSTEVPWDRPRLEWAITIWAESLLLCMDWKGRALNSDSWPSKRVHWKVVRDRNSHLLQPMSHFEINRYRAWGFRKFLCP